MPENGLLADGKRNRKVIGISPYPSLFSDKIKQRVKGINSEILYLVRGLPFVLLNSNFGPGTFYRISHLILKQPYDQLHY